MSSSVASGNQDWKQKPLQRGKSSPQDNKGDELTKLATDRLLLREFVEDDWQAVLAYQSEAQYLKYSPWPQRMAEEVRDFVLSFVEWQRERPRTKYQLAITLRGEGRLIGNCGIRMESADSRQANIGYEIAPGYWGESYATEAAQAMVEFGFRELRLHRIWARCVAENVASYRVLEKIGMRREGRLREEEWMQGRWWDTLVYGILDHEWRSRT
jgi:[ribosomal protein S5]-alanine N-acetyltransferase